MVTTVSNPICDYYDRVQSYAEAATRSTADQETFCPWQMPELDDEFTAFFSASNVSFASIDLGLERETTLLNMSMFERTHTTKTNPSLLMVARAVEHERRTGEAVTIVTASSGNKATALRAAVERAYELDLATPATLNIVSCVPAAAAPKLWSSTLTTDAHLRHANPLFILDAPRRDAVKSLVRDAQSRLGYSHEGRRLWYTLALDNYVVADQLRAAVEIDHFPTDSVRWHAHSVSSAYGLIGHSRGWDRFQPDHPHPGYYLVQHLDTPDMVLHLLHNSFDHSLVPEYQASPDGLYRQTESPHFPAVTQNPEECLETTFYTGAPATQDEMQTAINKHGGSGIVVSGHECASRYDRIREAVSAGDVTLPESPADLKEWSLVMAATGLIEGASRGLLEGVDSVVLHNTGDYRSDHYTPVPDQDLVALPDADPEAFVNHIVSTFKGLS